MVSLTTTGAPTTGAPTTRAPTTVELDNTLEVINEEGRNVNISILKNELNSNKYIYKISNNEHLNNQGNLELLSFWIQFKNSGSNFHNQKYDIPPEISDVQFTYDSINDNINNITYLLINDSASSYKLETLYELKEIYPPTTGAPTTGGGCSNGETTLELHMLDTSRNGWEGNNLEIYDSNGYIIYDNTLEVSNYSRDEFCLQNGIYNINVGLGNGDYKNEVRFKIFIKGNPPNGWDSNDENMYQTVGSYELIINNDTLNITKYSDEVYPPDVHDPYLHSVFPSDIRIHQGGTYNIILSMNYENIPYPYETVQSTGVGEIYNLNTRDSLLLDYYEIHQNGFISLYLEKGDYTYIPYSPANGIAIYDSTLYNIYQHNLIEENIIFFKYNPFEHYVIEGEFVDGQNNSNNEIHIIYTNGITEIHKISMTFEKYFFISIQTKSPIKEIKFKGSSKNYAKIHNEINYSMNMNEYNDDFFIGTFELNNNEKNTINTENYIFNNTLVSLELHNNIDKHNLTQVKYYEKEALIDGKYNILPEYYLSYKLELGLYKKIKQNLELPEKYEELNTFGIITNILKYTKIVTDKKNGDTIDTLISNLVSLDDSSGFLNKMQSIVSFENNEALYNECYNNVKNILNPYEIGRIICLITKNEGYITNDIKKVLIDYFLSVKNNILKLMDEVLIYGVIFIQHYLYILNNNIKTPQTSTRINILLAEIGKLCKQTDQPSKNNQIKKISELLNHFKIPKKFIIYITIFIQIFITFIFDKIDTISDLLKIKDTIIHVFLTMGVNENTNNGSLIITDEIFSFMSTVLTSEYAENYNNSNFEKFQSDHNNTESSTTSSIVLNTDAMKSHMFYMVIIILMTILNIQFLSNPNYSELYNIIIEEYNMEFVAIDDNNKDILSDLFCYFIDFISYQENHLPTTTSFVTTAAP